MPGTSGDRRRNAVVRTLGATYVQGVVPADRSQARRRRGRHTASPRPRTFTGNVTLDCDWADAIVINARAYEQLDDRQRSILATAADQTRAWAIALDAERRAERPRLTAAADPEAGNRRRARKRRGHCGAPGGHGLRVRRARARPAHAARDRADPRAQAVASGRPRRARRVRRAHRHPAEREGRRRRSMASTASRSPRRSCARRVSPDPAIIEGITGVYHLHVQGRAVLRGVQAQDQHPEQQQPETTSRANAAPTRSTAIASSRPSPSNPAADRLALAPDRPAATSGSSAGPRRTRSASASPARIRRRIPWKRITD